MTDEGGERRTREAWSDEERERRAQDLAIAAALRAQEVDARLRSSEQRLDRINGSIDRFTEALGRHEKRMSGIERAFGEFAAISKAVSDKGVSTRTFVLGVLAVLLPIILLFLSTGKHP